MYNLNFSMSWLPGDGKPLRPQPQADFVPGQMPEAPDQDLLPSGFQLVNMPSLSDTVGQIVLERERGDPLCQELCSAMLKLVLIRIMRNCGSEVPPMTTSARHIRRYIEEHCRELLTGEELGKALGYHPVYLNRVFRRETGLSIHRYQTLYRVRMACDMLSSTDLSIREIADSLGFAGASYFSEVFRKVMGKTPQEYRRSATRRG